MPNQMVVAPSASKRAGPINLTPCNLFINIPMNNIATATTTQGTCLELITPHLSVLVTNKGKTQL